MKFMCYFFVIFAILGWVLETVYRSVRNGRLVNPGFQKGCYLSIYGWGALIVLAGHMLLRAYAIPVRILFYFILLSALEFCTGLIMEVLFRTRLWDYSNERFNIRGHVCLRFSIIWTVLAVGLDFWLDFLIPWALQIHTRLYPAIDIVFSLILLTMIFDAISSVRRRLKERKGIVNEVAARQEFAAIAKPILTHPSFIKLKDFNHHLSKSRHDHVLEVAWGSFLIAKKLSLDCESTVRGALLHDLFYYDWLHEGPRFHGFRHHSIAFENARLITNLNEKESDIIKKHMWPLTIVPPRYMESLVVSLVDTFCSTRDYLRLNK
jgi:uncharacterized protein